MAGTAAIAGTITRDGWAASAGLRETSLDALGLAGDKVMQIEKDYDKEV